MSQDQGPAGPVESFDEWQARRQYAAEQRGRPPRRGGDTWGRPVLLVAYRVVSFLLLLYIANVAYRVNSGLDALARFGESLQP